MKFIGTVTDAHARPESPIKVEVDERDIVFISQSEEHIIVISKNQLPLLVQVLQRVNE